MDSAGSVTRDQTLTTVTSAWSILFFNLVRKRLLVASPEQDESSTSSVGNNVGLRHPAPC